MCAFTKRWPSSKTSGLGKRLSWRLSRDRRQDLCDRKRWCLKNCFAMLWPFLLDLTAYNHGLKGPRSPKHIATMAFRVPIFHPLSLLLGLDPCGDRILRSCLQKADNTCQLREEDHKEVVIWGLVRLKRWRSKTKKNASPMFSCDLEASPRARSCILGPYIRYF